MNNLPAVHEKLWIEYDMLIEKVDKPTLEELVLQEEGFIHAEHLPLPFTAQEIMEVR